MEFLKAKKNRSRWEKIIFNLFKLAKYTGGNKRKGLNIFIACVGLSKIPGHPHTTACWLQTSSRGMLESTCKNISSVVFLNFFNSSEFKKLKHQMTQSEIHFNEASVKSVN